MAVLLFTSWAVAFAVGRPDLISAPPIWWLWLMQALQSVGLFALPFILFRMVQRGAGYSIASGFNLASAMLSAAALVAAYPFVNYLSSLNEDLHLPAALAPIEQWMRGTEAQAQALIERLIEGTTLSQLALNTLMIAAIPAIAEELFFRGTLQPLIVRAFKSRHLAVWLTAAVFSFLHFQFLGFLPRLVLGALLGYVAHWSGGLILGMVGHFANNAFAVLALWFIGRGQLSPSIETLGADHWWLAVASAAAALTIALALKHFLGPRNRHDRDKIA